MSATEQVTFTDVEVIGDTGLALHCVYHGKHLWVGEISSRVVDRG